MLLLLLLLLQIQVMITTPATNTAYTNET